MQHKVLDVSLSMAVLALVVAVSLATAPAAQAAKPPPAPTATPIPLDTGWIYSFGGAGAYRAIYRTSPDGTVNGGVAGAPADYGWFVADPPAVPGGGSVGRPSHLPHDGSRWYLAFRWDSADVIFPNAGGGSTALDVDAVRQGSTTGATLTSGRTACIYMVGESAAWASSAAGTSDAVVTWLGAQWANQDGDPAGTCETLVSGGIFRANLTFNTAGAVIGASAPVLAVPVPMKSNNTPDVRFFSWSPDGASVAYTRDSNGALYVAAAGSPIANHVQLAAGNYRNVDWSPDQDAATAGLQTTIAFSGWSSGGKVKGGVWVVKPNGTGLTLLAEAVLGNTVKYAHQTPFWSPKGSHLAYEEHQTQAGAPTYSHTIRRMAKDGSGNVVLVTESPAQPIQALLAWTDAD